MDSYDKMSGSDKKEVLSWLVGVGGIIILLISIFAYYIIQYNRIAWVRDDQYARCINSSHSVITDCIKILDIK